MKSCNNLKIKLIDIGWQFDNQFRFWLLGNRYGKYSVMIFIVAVMIGLPTIPGRIKLPYPILLIIAVIGIGFLPSIPPLSLNSEIIFLIFLPPLS